MRFHTRFVGLTSVLLVVGSSLLAACSSAPVTLESQPKAYGSLTVAPLFGSGFIDPQVSLIGSFLGVGQAVFDTLVALDVNDRQVPGLAERWEISDDGMSHTFYIRKGIKFQDGSELTGSDVKFSIERMLAPEAASSRSPLWRAVVAKIELKDDYTVVLRMNSPQFELLPDTDSSMTAVVPKKYIEEKGVDYFRRNPVGSGPWKVVKYQPGVRLDLEAVETHWRAKPQFENITVLAVPEESTKVAMLKTGELDLADVTVDSLPGLKAAGARVVHYEGGPLYFGWPFYDVTQPEKYAFGDVRVRKALQLGINQQEIADKLLGGNGRPMAMYSSPTAYFFDPNVLKPDPYDPEGAKKLLAEAGYATGFNTRLYDVGGGGELSTISQALAGYLLKIGVKAEMVTMEFSAFRPLFSPKQKPEIWNSLFTYFVTDFGGFNQMISGFHSTKGAPKNLNNPKLDELIDKVPITKDLTEKKRLALEAAVMAKNEYSSLMVVRKDVVQAMGSKVGDYEHRSGMLRAIAYSSISHAK